MKMRADYAKEDQAVMTLDEMRDFVAKQDWIFAKTYADRAPHEYMLRERLVGDEASYNDFVRTILEKGMEMSFWYQKRRYVYLDERLYWVMDSSVESTTLINRSDLNDYEIVILSKLQNSEQTKEAKHG